MDAICSHNFQWDYTDLFGLDAIFLRILEGLPTRYRTRRIG